MAKQDFSNRSQSSLIRDQRIGTRPEERATPVLVPRSPEPTPVVTDPKEIEATVFGCSLLNVRDSATKNSRVLYTIPQGTKLVVEYFTDEWARIVTIDGFVKPGYVMRDYLKVE